MKTIKVVLTGGPCGGKSESIIFFQKQLVELGFSVSFIDETASSLFALGYMPNVNISAFDFQNLLFKIQFLKEYFNENKSELLLCDRGLLDGKVYTTVDDFEKILSLNKADEDLILSTYDISLYFRSISYEYPEMFMLKRTSESPEIAMFRDKKCIEVWIKKILSCEYSNLNGFRNKQEAIFSSLRRKLDFLEIDNVHNLSDYYDNQYINFLFRGIEDIMNNNKVEEGKKNKTRSLII